MSRPSVSRTATTNLSNNPSARVLEGKLAIVTGASRGIGAAICQNLASKGCSLVMNYTSESSSSKTADLASSLESTHDIRAFPVQADMGFDTGPGHIVSVAKNHFSHPKSGKFQIDIIINNAGVAGNHPLGDIKIEEFNRQYNINVLGPILLMQAALPYLPNDRSGRIINLSSVSSSLGFSGQTVYGGTKAALEAMTRTWARELCERATVNAVNPGPVATDMYGRTTREFQERMSSWTQNTPLARVRPDIDEQRFVENEKFAGGRPAYDYEVAGVVGMLCTPDAGWTTGSVVCANGGMKFSY